jgi:hypothetical protein
VQGIQDAAPHDPLDVKNENLVAIDANAVIGAPIQLGDGADYEADDETVNDSVIAAQGSLS